MATLNQTHGTPPAESDYGDATISEGNAASGWRAHSGIVYEAGDSPELPLIMEHHKDIPDYPYVEPAQTVKDTWSVFG